MSDEWSDGGLIRLPQYKSLWHPDFDNRVYLTASLIRLCNSSRDREF